MTTADEMVDRVFRALLRGELGTADLGARTLSMWLGQSTMGLYHHFGSLDGFLIRVDGEGWRYLLDRLDRAQREGAGLEQLGLSYVRFATAHPALYEIMAVRSFDRARFRAEGRLRAEKPLLEGFHQLLSRAGSVDPERDAVLVFAGLHGLASLATSGRLDLGIGKSPRQRLREAVENVVRVVRQPRSARQLSPQRRRKAP